MKPIIKILTVGALLLSAHTANAQVMTLDQCIEYAMQHSHDLEQQRLNTENKKIQLNTTQMSRLPNLNASVGQGWSFGRGVSRDGTTVDRTSAQTSFQVGTSLPVFTGFRIPNQVKAQKFDVLAATEDLEAAKLNLSIQIAVYYLNALFYRSLTGIQHKQLDLDKEALKYATTLFEEGRKPKSEVAVAEAQVATTQKSLTEAQGNETMALLNLMQAMNMTESDMAKFAVCEVDTTNIDGNIDSAAELFARAVETNPSIRAAQYSLKSSEYNLKATRAGWMPTLNFNASYSNSYFYVYDQDNQSFGKQFNLNGSEYVGLSLSIPIFDRFQTRNAMRQARLSISSQNIQLAKAKLSLEKEIQQAYWNAINAHKSYESAQKAYASTSLAYNYEAERYAAGRGTAYELQQARTKMERSAQDEVQAKYDLIMRLKILEFYVPNK